MIGASPDAAVQGVDQGIDHLTEDIDTATVIKVSRAWTIYGEWGLMGINFHP